MARTTATTRQTATVRTTASARTAISSFRIPVALAELGVSNFWTWRNAYTGSLNPIVRDEFSGIETTVIPQTSMSNIYTTGLYQAYLDYDQGDLVTGSQYKQIFTSGVTSISVFGFFGPHWTDITGALFGQSYDEESALGDKKTFSLSQAGAGTVSHPTIMLSQDGAAEYVVKTTDPVFTAQDQYHFIEATYDSVAGVKIYVDGVSVAVTVVSGSLPTGIFGGRGPIEVGVSTSNGVQGSFWGGKVGMFGIAKSTAHSASQALALFNILNSIGLYI